jgi:hypothetical protein
MDIKKKEKNLINKTPGARAENQVFGTVKTEQKTVCMCGLPGFFYQCPIIIMDFEYTSRDHQNHFHFLIVKIHTYIYLNYLHHLIQFFLIVFSLHELA